jgi:chromatin segregation and condensation protein Rec8/ScpA/Scc1 (kleisin family)
MLELVRQGIMDVIQESDFSDMEIIRTERGLTDEISE